MSYQIEWLENGVKVKFTDTISFELVESCNQQITGDKRYSHVNFLLYNYLDLDSFKIDLSDVHELGIKDVGKSYAQPSLKVALVTSNSELIALSEIYKAMWSTKLRQPS
jgi:hypothetical protein